MSAATFARPDLTTFARLDELGLEFLRHGVPAALTELRTLRRALGTRAADVLAYFDRPGTSNGPTEAMNGRLEHLLGSALGFRKPDQLNRPQPARDRRLQTPTTPSTAMSREYPSMSAKFPPMPRHDRRSLLHHRKIARCIKWGSDARMLIRWRLRRFILERSNRVKHLLQPGQGDSRSRAPIASTPIHPGGPHNAACNRGHWTFCGLSHELGGLSENLGWQATAT